jgi:hypothetical protein
VYGGCGEGVACLPGSQLGREEAEGEKRLTVPVGVCAGHCLRLHAWLLLGGHPRYHALSGGRAGPGAAAGGLRAAIDARLLLLLLAAIGTCPLAVTIKRHYSALSYVSHATLAYLVRRAEAVRRTHAGHRRRRVVAARAGESDALVRRSWSPA